MLDGGKAQRRKHDNHWIVTDSEGAVHGRVEASTRKAAERMAFAILPDLEDGGRVLGWYEARSDQRFAAKQAFPITPALCLKQGTPVMDHWAGQLSRRFARVGGVR